MKLSPDLRIPRLEYRLNHGKKLIVLKLPVQGKSFEDSNRNVFLVDANETIVWQVANHDLPHDGDTFYGDDPFTGLWVSDDGQVTGLTWDGWRFRIDLNNGEITKIGWTKS